MEYFSGFLYKLADTPATPRMEPARALTLDNDTLLRTITSAVAAIQSQHGLDGGLDAQLLYWLNWTLNRRRTGEDTDRDWRYIQTLIVRIQQRGIGRFITKR